MNTLFVAGTFNDEGGKHSGLADKLFNELTVHDDWAKVTYLNGGYWSEIADLSFADFDQIFWLANIPNDKPKIVGQIKEQNPKCMLITSKNNTKGLYDALMIVGRALQSKSNLLIEFTKQDDLVAMSVWDALGNVYVWREVDTYKVAQLITRRLCFLRRVQRIPSERAGDAIEAPDRYEFFSLAQEHAAQFHSLIHAVNSGRFVGNLSFRCESGFPSFREDGLIFVSRRNIDKRHISRDGFVAVDPNSTSIIKYYGDHKPSVDTPIQVRLYKMFPRIRYMLHSHVYIEGAPFTKNVIPCGGVEECYEVGTAVGVKDDRSFFMANLLGHGSLVAMDHYSRLSRRPLLGLPITYQARPVPERIDLR